VGIEQEDANNGRWKLFAMQMSETHKREVRRKGEYIRKTENESTSNENESSFPPLIHYFAQILLH
jgi:hypothetical protein